MPRNNRMEISSLHLNRSKVYSNIKQVKADYKYYILMNGGTFKSIGWYMTY